MQLEQTSPGYGLVRRSLEVIKMRGMRQDFAFIASPDLKEPLRKVTAFGERLKRRYGEVLDNQGRDYLERMTGAASRMSTQVDSLLEYSRVASRARPFTSIDLKALIQEVLIDLEVRMEKSGAQVEISDLPVIEADPQQMQQLFQNLIGNALKFNREEKPVVKIYSSGCSNGTCRIYVQDNGIGFDEKHVQRIFAPFQRLHGRSEFEGTGMGLAICRKIVERHTGAITANSTPGEGATFIIQLPVKQSQSHVEEHQWKS